MTRNATPEHSAKTDGEPGPCVACGRRTVEGRWKGNRWICLCYACSQERVGRNRFVPTSGAAEADGRSAMPVGAHGIEVDEDGEIAYVPEFERGQSGSLIGRKML